MMEAVLDGNIVKIRRMIAQGCNVMAIRIREANYKVQQQWFEENEIPADVILQIVLPLLATLDVFAKPRPLEAAVPFAHIDAFGTQQRAAVVMQTLLDAKADPDVTFGNRSSFRVHLHEHVRVFIVCGLTVFVRRCLMRSS